MFCQSLRYDEVINYDKVINYNEVCFMSLYTHSMLRSIIYIKI